jgi:hypothetical protein
VLLQQIDQVIARGVGRADGETLDVREHHGKV